MAVDGSAVSLRRLWYYAVLAEELNYTNAAQRLHMTQPALTQQIKTLERELGTSLIHRHRGRTELTAAGEVAAIEARDLLSRAHAAAQRIIDTAAGVSDRLTLAYTRSATGAPASDIVTEFRHRHPDVELSLETGWTTANLDKLDDGSIDLAFIRPPALRDNISVVTVNVEEILIALPINSDLAKYDELTREQLKTQDVVFWPRANGPGLYDRIASQVWGDAGPRVVREEPDDEHLLRSVADAVGIAAVPSTRARSLHIPGVALRPLVSPTPTIELALAWLTKNTTSYIEQMAQIAREISVGPGS